MDLIGNASSSHPPDQSPGSHNDKPGLSQDHTQVNYEERSTEKSARGPAAGARYADLLHSSAIEFGLMLNDHWLTMDPAIVIQLEYHHTP